jgi:hypothetical protein
MTRSASSSLSRLGVTAVRAAPIKPAGLSRALDRYLPKLSFSPVMRLNTGASGRWSFRSVMK